MWDAIFPPPSSCSEMDENTSDNMECQHSYARLRGYAFQFTSKLLKPYMNFKSSYMAFKVIYHHPPAPTLLIIFPISVDSLLNVCLDCFCLEMCVDCYHPKRKEKEKNFTSSYLDQDYSWATLVLVAIQTVCVDLFTYCLWCFPLCHRWQPLSDLQRVSTGCLHQFSPAAPLHVHRNFLTPAITDRLPPCYRWPVQSVDARKYGRAPAAAGARVSKSELRSVLCAFFIFVCLFKQK